MRGKELRAVGVWARRVQAGSDELTKFRGSEEGAPRGFSQVLLIQDLKCGRISSCGSVDSERLSEKLLL